MPHSVEFQYDRYWDNPSYNRYTHFSPSARHYSPNYWLSYGHTPRYNTTWTRFSKWSAWW